MWYRYILYFLSVDSENMTEEVAWYVRISYYVQSITVMSHLPLHDNNPRVLSPHVKDYCLVCILCYNIDIPCVYHFPLLSICVDDPLGVFLLHIESFVLRFVWIVHQYRSYTVEYSCQAPSERAYCELYLYCICAVDHNGHVLSSKKDKCSLAYCICCDSVGCPLSPCLLGHLLLNMDFFMDGFIGGVPP